MSLVSWTDERIDTLRRAAADGLTASQIAAELGGITRNAVLGKMHRMGLRLMIKQGHRPPKPKGTPRPKQTRRYRGLWPAVGEIQVVPDIEVVDLPSDQSPFACPIDKLTDATCRWPLGDPRHDMSYCGAWKHTGLPYCLRHARIAYKKTERRG